MAFLIDAVAKDLAVSRWGIPECLHVPIAAVDEDAIRNYVGDIVQVLGRGTPPNAFLIHAKEPPEIDRRFPIWDIEGSKIFHRREQVWVRAAYTRYRPAYRKALPSDDIQGKILSHTMNRRLAAVKGFQYSFISSTQTLPTSC